MRRFILRFFPIVALVMTCTNLGQPEYRSYPLHITWSPNGRMIAASGYNFAWVIDVESGEVILDIPVNEVEVDAQDWSPDSNRLALSFAGSIYIWDVLHKTQIFDFEMRQEYMGYIGDLDWSSDGTMLASTYDSVSLGHGIYLWETETYQKIDTIPDLLASDLEIHPNNQLIAFAYFGSPPQMLNLTNRNDEPILLDESNALSFSWSDDGLWLIIGNSRGVVTIWDVSNQQLLQSFFVGEARSISAIDLSFDRQRIALVTGFAAQVRTIEGNLIYTTEPVTSFTTDFSPYGGQIAFSELVLPSLMETTTIIPQKNARLLGDGLLQIVVPDPTIDRLNMIAESCIAPDARVTSVSDEARLAEFVTTIEALSDDQIPAGCQADLLAVAEAIEALR